MSDNSFDRISKSLAARSSRRQALKLLGGGLAVGALGTVGLSQVATAQNVNDTPFSGLPISGTVEATGQAVSGVLNITQFVNDGGTSTAVGQFVPADGSAVEPQGFTATDIAATGDCQILNLTLGPIYLDVLGLVVEVPVPIVLNIFADPGAGKLLGNLLCAVANLLNNSNSPLGAIAGLLNRILSILG